MKSRMILPEAEINASTGVSVKMPEFIPVVRPADFRRLRTEELHQTMSEFGRTLKDAVHPGAPPYSRQYVDRIEKGKDRITEELQAAFFVVAGVLDGMAPGIGGVIEVKVLALPGQIQSGAYIPVNYVSVRCALPGCPVVFVKPQWSRQRYHCGECRQKMAKIRRQEVKA